MLSNSLALKVSSLALGNRDSSSKIARKAIGFSNIAMQGPKSIPKSTFAQSRPSLTYSSCSRVNM
jgi:hypothetical protein